MGTIGRPLYVLTPLLCFELGVLASSDEIQSFFTEVLEMVVELPIFARWHSHLTQSKDTKTATG